jgi:hypothetical protein
VRRLFGRRVYWVSMAGVMLLPQSCVPVITYTEQDTRINEYLGFTICHKNKGVGFANVNGAAVPNTFRGTIAHEQKHIEQVARIGTCAGYAAWLSENRHLAEAEAFCEDAKNDMLPPRSWPREVAVRYYAGWLSNHRAYPLFDMSQDSAVALMGRFC